MANYTINYTGKTYNVRGDRPLNGGVSGSNYTGLQTDIVTQLNELNNLTNAANGVTPVVPVALANTNTKTVPLSTAAVPFTLYRTTSDGTIAGAVLNFPTTGLVDGSQVQFVTSGVVTAVTGTLSSAPIPVLSATVAGKLNKFVYNLAATTWFAV